MNIKIVAAAAILMASFAFADGDKSQGATGAAGPNTTQNVNVVNIPTVSIGGAAQPLAVKDIDNAARQPFTHTDGSLIQSGSTCVTGSPVAVPAGKRLVVEQLNGSVYVPKATGQIGRVELIVPSNTMVIPLTFMGRTNAFSELWGANPLTRIYVDSVNSLSVSVCRTPGALDTALPSGDAFGAVTIHGYLVNLP